MTNEFTSTEIANLVLDRLDGKAPTVNGEVALEQIVVAVLEVLVEHRFVGLQKAQS